MLIVLLVTDKRVWTFYVGFYDHLEIYCFYSSKIAILVEVCYFDEAFISHWGVLVGSDVEETYDATLLWDDHDWMDGREWNVDYSALHD